MRDILFIKFKQCAGVSTSKSGSILKALQMLTGITVTVRRGEGVAEGSALAACLNVTFAPAVVFEWNLVQIMQKCKEHSSKWLSGIGRMRLIELRINLER